jgi:adenylate cyclase
MRIEAAGLPLEEELSTGAGYRFGAFVLDLGRLSLLEKGRPVELRPKAFNTLRFLAENAGRVVTKDELVAAVWPDVIVNDDALAQCIRDIRKALGDEGQAFIKTVPRRGDLFVPEVRRVDAAGDPPSPAAATRWSMRRRLAVGLSVAVACIVGVAAVAWSSWRADSPFVRDRHLTVAVLPFETSGDVEADAWLGEGFAEDIMTAMSRFRDVAVIARNSSFRYRGEAVDPEVIRRDLHADFLLQGGVRRSEGLARITVQLVDTRTGTNRWVERYDRPLADLFAV